MTRVKAPSAENLDRRLFLLEATSLLGLSGCLGGPPEEGTENTPPPIAQFRAVNTMAGDGDPVISFGG
ncbi:MAG TPA: hypothetical protein VFL86_15855, partial [Burkholderiaceae bacterium]|nr:hypothetical protein [Burkholderiaceae bacterium]